MAKRNLQWTEEKMKKFIKEGRGEGELSNYKPWWNIQDFPSYGRVSRLVGWKSNRIHHLFSDIETYFLYLLDWEDSIIDIREHFPMLDYAEVVDDVANLRLDKFKDKTTCVPYVITTTFLLTIRSKSGSNKYVARSVKGSSELEKTNTLERLEIERRYWNAKKIDWGIVTEKEIDVVKAKNIEWVHPCLRESREFGITDKNKNYFCKVILERLSWGKDYVRDVLSKIDEEFNLEDGTSLYLFKYLVAKKVIEVNLSEKIEIQNNVSKVIKSIKREGVEFNGTTGTSS